jgi:hypothetical protein
MGVGMNGRDPAFKDAYAYCLIAALDTVRLDNCTYELNHGLRVALTTSAAESKWLDGEDVFAEVQTAAPMHPPQRAFVMQLSAEATGT